MNIKDMIDMDKPFRLSEDEVQGVTAVAHAALQASAAGSASALIVVSSEYLLPFAMVLGLGVEAAENADGT